MIHNGRTATEVALGRRLDSKPALRAPWGQAGRTVLETVLVLLFISVLLVAAADRLTASVRSLRENALTVELSNLRTAVNFFTLLNRRLPASLNELIEAEAVVPGTSVHGPEHDVVVIGKFVESMTVDEEGVPLDPFGNRYAYDPADGAVHSTTARYKNW